jgi:hypothetical protein
MSSHHYIVSRTLAILFVCALFAGGLGLAGQMGNTAQAAPYTGEDGGGCAPWTLVPAPAPRTHHYLNDVDALSPNDIWAVGEYYDERNYTPDTALAMHWDGTAWTIFPTPPTGQRGELRGVSMVSSNDVWAVGLKYPGGAYIPLALHWDGVAWTEVPTPTEPGGLDLRDVVAIASNDVWAVGANDGLHDTRAMHWDGAQWTIVPTPNGGNFSDDNVLESVTAISPNDIWAVGYIYPEGGTQRTLALHWNGTQWTLVNTPNPGNYVRALFGVHAVASNDVWAVGTYSADFGKTYLPLFLRWNGTQWTHVQGPIFPDYSVLRDVHAVSANDVWAVGTNAACNFCEFDTLVMHWDGTQWTREASPNGFRDFSRLQGVTSTSPNETWAVGFSDQYGFPYTSDPLIMRRTCTAGGTPTATSVIPTRTATSVASTPTATSAVPTLTQVPASATSVAGTATQVPSTSTVAAPSATAANATPTVTRATATTVALTATPTACTVSFSDVQPQDTFYPFIRCLACRGIIGGYADGTFRPNNNITRGQIAKMVSNSAGFSEPITGQSFEDVPPASPFYEFVERLYRRGHMGGYPCGQRETETCIAPENRPYFRPNEDATRGQLSKIVANAAGYSEPVSGQFFADVTGDNPFYSEIMRLTNRNVMSGYPCGGEGEPCDSENRPYFRWANPVTRGQASKIVANTFYPGCEQ